MEEMSDLQESQLEVVYNPLKKASLDIVVVHGFERQARSPEAEDLDQPMWIQDFLPSHVPNARIMVFKCQGVASGDGSLISEEGLEQSSDALLTALREQRVKSTYKNASIAFIAQDLGGIVVKKALVTDARSKIKPSIATFAHRLIFFGTPHRANSAANWSDLVFNILFASRASLPFIPNLSSRVTTFSNSLTKVSAEFNSLNIRHSFVNIYQHPSNGAVENEPIIINSYASTTGFVGETNIERQSSHRHLFKFHESDKELSLIGKFLNKETDKVYTKCLSILESISSAFILPTEDEYTVENAPLGEQSDFDAWLQARESSIFYAHGRSGVGKGSISAALYTDLKQTTSTVAYFSFSSHDHRRSSALPLLSSFILQILDQAQDTFPQIRQLYISIQRERLWTQTALWVLFESLVRVLKSGPLYLIINGVHNCDSSRDEFLNSLLGLFNDKDLGIVLKVALFGQECADIREAMVKFGHFRLQDLTVQKTPARLANEFELSHSPQHQNLEYLSEKSFKSEIETLPLTVANIVSETYQNLPKWAGLALGWMLHAQRPLKANELGTAIALSDLGDGQDQAFEKDDCPLDLLTQLNSVFGFLVIFENDEIHLRHDQVRNCFQEAVKKQQDEAKAKSAEEAKETLHVPDDADITFSLLKYLSSDKFIQTMKKSLKDGGFNLLQDPEFDLALYAVQFWPAHHRNAKSQKSFTDRILPLLQTKDFVQIWSELSTQIDSTSAPPDLCVVDPMLLAAQLGFPSLIKHFHREIIGPAREVAIALASWGDHYNIVKDLLDKDSLDKDSLDEKSVMKTGDATLDLSQALKYASARGNAQLTELLMGHIQKPEEEHSFDPGLLRQVCELGYLELVKTFVGSGIDVNVACDGITPLQCAARNGHASIVSFLMTKDVDVNSEASTDPNKPLLYAVKNGHEDVFRLLLSSKAININVMDDGDWNSLHLAASLGYYQIVELLLEYLRAHPKKENLEKSDTPSTQQDENDTSVLAIDSKDDSGQTPLLLASKMGHLKIVELLLKEGADADVGDDGGTTALNEAVSQRHERVARVILQHNDLTKSEGDKEKDRDERNKIRFRLLAGAGFTNLIEQFMDKLFPNLSHDDNEFKQELDDLIRATDDKGQTPLHHAAKGGHKATVSWLLSKGSSVDPCDNTNYTPLSMAAMYGHVEVVRFLLQKGANPLQKSTNEETIISQVIQNNGTSRNHIKIIEILIGKGIDLNLKDANEKSSLHHAVIEENVRAVQLLLRHGADTSLRSKYLWNALHWAARYGNAKVAQLLKDAGVDPLAIDDEGWTPMHVAALWGKVDVMNILWNPELDYWSFRTSDGRNLLHFAYDEPRSVEWLMEHGAGLLVNEADHSGYTPMMRVFIAGSDPDIISEIVGMLLSHNADIHLTNRHNQTVLHFAAREERLEAARKIMDKDPRVIHVQDDESYTALHRAVLGDKGDVALLLLSYQEQSGLDLNIQNKDGNTPLLLALKKGQQQVARKLLELGAAPRIQNKAKETALTLTIQKRELLPLLELLVKRSPSDDAATNDEWQKYLVRGLYIAAQEASPGAGTFHQLLELDENLNVNLEGGDNGTILNAAILTGNELVVGFLLERGANANLPCAHFSNALSGAIYSGLTGAVFSLISKGGAVIDAPDRQGRTSMHIAAWSGFEEVFDMLLEEGGNPAVRDKQGRTILHYAATSHSREIVRKILKSEELKSLNVPDVHGWTPLHWACRDDENWDAVVLLLKEQPDGTNETEFGWNLENVAIFHQADEIVSLIKSSSEDEDEETKEQGEGELEDDSNLKEWSRGISHDEYFCDGCFQKPIYGVRWHCNDCRSLDFCFKCYWTHEETEPGHSFEKVGEGPERNPERLKEVEDDDSDDDDD